MSSARPLFFRPDHWHSSTTPFLEAELAKGKLDTRRLLAERVVATWLQVGYFEGLQASTMYKSITNAQDNYHQKRLDQAYRRQLSAIRTLAQIRKPGPAVQINIAEKQINTAG